MDTIDDIKNLPIEMIVKKSKEYFNELLNYDSINILDKKGGVQLGKIVDIKKGNDFFRYFVKTHS